MARPIKLTPELQTQICDTLAAGNYIDAVCDYVGISTSTFYDWIKRGERGWKKDIEEGFVGFSDAVKKARARAEISSVARIRKAAQDGQWQADAWFLERSIPERWGRRRLELTGTDGDAIETKANVSFDYSKLSTGEIENLIRLAELARTGEGTG